MSNEFTVTTIVPEPTSDKGRTVAEIEVELAALDAEFAALVTAQNSGEAEGSLLETLVSKLPRVQELMMDKQQAKQRREALGEFVQAQAAAQVARRRAFEMRELQARLNALKVEVDSYTTLLVNESNVSKVQYNVALNVGVSQSVLSAVVDRFAGIGEVQS
jgi:hypothetical protein